MKQRKGHRWIVVMLAVAGLLAGCSDDMPDTSAEANEIRFRADVWRVMEGTRATTFNGGTLTSGSFTASAYNAGTTTVYFSPTTINWVTDKWVFSDGKHYWPMSGNLDFFAYMPATEPSYIKDITYAANNPQFTCEDLPMTHSEQESISEFVYALESNRAKGSDVDLSFQHPFARIKLQFSSGQEDIHINSITFRSIKNNGTYTHSGGWTPSGDATDLVLTLNGDYIANDDIGIYLMVPQTFAGNIAVTATWIDWGVSLAHTLTKKIDPVTWSPGYSYTYTFTITENDLKVSTEKYTEQW